MSNPVPCAFCNDQTCRLCHLEKRTIEQAQKLEKLHGEMDIIEEKSKCANDNKGLLPPEARGKTMPEMNAIRAGREAWPLAPPANVYAPHEWRAQSYSFQVNFTAVEKSRLLRNMMMKRNVKDVLTLNLQVERSLEDFAAMIDFSRDASDEHQRKVNLYRWLKQRCG